MSSKYPVLPPHKIIKVLEKYGFEKVAQKRSHAKYKNKITGMSYIIPIHTEIAKGTLKSILEQSHVELKDFLKYLSSFLF